MSKQPFMPAKPDHVDVSEPTKLCDLPPVVDVSEPTKLCDLPPVSLKLKSPFTIGSKPSKQIDSGDTDAAVNRGMKVEVDWVRRVVWVHYDNGARIASGWTPFENIAGINYGSHDVVKEVMAPAAE